MKDNVNFARAYGLRDLDKARIGKRRLKRMAGYDIASKYGCHYMGDVNVIDHGGYFYTLNHHDLEAGFVSAVKIVPDDETEGAFWLEDLTINLPDTSKETGREKLLSALQCCGWETEEIGPHHIVDALVSYGAFDCDSWYFKGSDLTENQALNLVLDHLDLPRPKRKIRQKAA